MNQGVIFFFVYYFLQIRYFEEVVRVKEDVLEDMQKVYEDQLNKFIVLIKEREIVWNKQKEEIEVYYL